jgi:hypothetical protein
LLEITPIARNNRFLSFSRWLTRIAWMARRFLTDKLDLKVVGQSTQSAAEHCIGL